MRIAFFHELTPLSGARKVIGEYGKILAKNYTIDLFYVDNIEDKKNINIFNKVFFFEFKQKKYQGKDWKSRLYIDTIELIKLYSLHKKISNIMEENKYDFVFINPSKFTQAPFLLRFINRSVYFCQEPLRIAYEKDLGIPKDLSPYKKIYELLTRNIRKKIDSENIKKTNIILANSEFSQKNIKRIYRRSSSLCYLGVDVDRFKPLDIEKEYDILFLGQKDRIEGYNLLLEAIGLFDKKPMVKVIERNEDGLGINDEQLVREYNKAKILVVLSRNEPFGLIPLEAMSCGVAVVAVSEGGFQESIIDGKTGLLIKRNSKDLYLVLVKLLKNDALRKQLGANSREYVIENWTWEKSVKRFLEIIDKI